MFLLQNGYFMNQYTSFKYVYFNFKAVFIRKFIFLRKGNHFLIQNLVQLLLNLKDIASHLLYITGKWFSIILLGKNSEQSCYKRFDINAINY